MKKSSFSRLGAAHGKLARVSDILNNNALRGAKARPSVDELNEIKNLVHDAQVQIATVAIEEIEN